MQILTAIFLTKHNPDCLLGPTTGHLLEVVEDRTPNIVVRPLELNSDDNVFFTVKNSDVDQTLQSSQFATSLHRTTSNPLIVPRKPTSDLQPLAWYLDIVHSGLFQQGQQLLVVGLSSVQYQAVVFGEQALLL